MGAPLAGGENVRGRPRTGSGASPRAEGDWLSVTAWVRAGGLRLLPIILIRGQVDNPEAALAFVEELSNRKASVEGAFKLLGLLDYRAPWLLAGFVIPGLLRTWRRRSLSESE